MLGPLDFQASGEGSELFSRGPVPVFGEPDGLVTRVGHRAVTPGHLCCALIIQLWPQVQLEARRVVAEDLRLWQNPNPGLVLQNIPSVLGDPQSQSHCQGGSGALKVWRGTSLLLL